MRRSELKMRLCGALVMCASLLHAGTVITSDGTFYEGALTLDNGITVKGPAVPVKLPFSSVLRARFAPSNPLSQPGLVLVNGARIAGAFSSLGEPLVKIPAKNIAIPSKEIAWAIYQPVHPALAAQAPKGKTGALLQNGDFFEGTFRGGDASTAKLLSPVFGPRTFTPWELHALVLRDVQPQPGAYDVLTRDGSIYPALDVLATNGTAITLRHTLYNGLRVPLPEITEIRASRSRVVSLDEVRPTRLEIPQGREPAACFAANRALAGGPLKLGTRTVTAGFECATGAAVWWKPPPGAGTFFALVAASAGTPAGQELTFCVYADGKVVGRSRPLAAGDLPSILRCAVPGAESLVLRIEGTGGAASNGTWAEPMLLLR